MLLNIPACHECFGRAFAMSCLLSVWQALLHLAWQHVHCFWTKLNVRNHSGGDTGCLCGAGDVVSVQLICTLTWI